MNKGMIFLIIVVFLINSLVAYSTSNEKCLKLIWNNDYHKEWNKEWHKWDWKGNYNTDSIKIDSCVNSPTYGKLFAKKYFLVKFKPNSYPLDRIINSETFPTSNNNTYKINSKNMTQGVYLVTLSSNGHRVTEKLIVVK